jgi:hypothetical protein
MIIIDSGGLAVHRHAFEGFRIFAGAAEQDHQTHWPPVYFAFAFSFFVFLPLSCFLLIFSAFNPRVLICARLIPTLLSAQSRPKPMQPRDKVVSKDSFL